MSRDNHRIEFTGHSDDIIEVKTTRFVHFCDAIGDSISEAESEITAELEGSTQIKVSSIGGARVCVVHATYTSAGTWCFAVAMLEEGRRLPPWTFTIDQPDQPDHDYTTRLVIDAGDDDLIYEKIVIV